VKHAVLACALASAAAAAADGWGLYPIRPVDFSLGFSRHTLDLRAGGARFDTTVERIGITWRERYGARLQLGFTGGYSALTQTNNPVTAGRELDGYHAGVLLDFDVLRSERAALFFNAAWLYQHVDDDDGTQRIVLSWSEPSARFGAGALLGGGLWVYGGVRHGIIDGRQRLSGAVNETQPIEQTDRTGGFAGLELVLDREGGYAGLTAESGPDRSVGVYFGRRF